jgi:immunity protein 50 of polymorphic toxin system
METRPDITGSELVTQVFGYWPSFHDAEVVRMSLETTASPSAGPDVRADIYAFEITNEVAPDGTLVLRHKVLVSFRFSGVDNLLVKNFGNQNAIMGLSIVDIRSRQMEAVKFEVRFDGSFSFSAEFLCREVFVESVRAWKPQPEGAV